MQEVNVGSGAVKGKKILVVDDEPDVRDYLSSFLEDEGFEIRTAENGLSAINLIGQERPDLILLDLLMPESTGAGFYRKLQEKEEFKDIPVIVISGMVGKDVTVMDFVQVLDKPIDRDRLLTIIQAALTTDH
jgi:CheY-like chemotaxis protein